MHPPTYTPKHNSPQSRLLALLLVMGSTLYTQVTCAAEIQIRDLEDINFGLVPATIGDLDAGTSYCVAMAPRGRYSLLGTGDGPGGTFVLIETGTGLHTIAYSVRIADRGGRRGRLLRPNIPLSNLRASRQRNNGRCNPQGTIQVLIEGGSIAAALPGSYLGTLSLTVVPE